MTYYITYLSDILGNNYLGIKLPNETVQPFLNDFKDIVGEDDYIKYTDLQKNRDHGDYHITVINVMDFNRLSKEMGIDKFVNSLNSIFKYEIDDLKMMGVGTAERNGNRAYFVVCDSNKLDAVRDRYGLPKHDFHSTLGFFHKDVFGIRKNEVLKKEGKFLKLLSQEFYKSDNWNFIKRISNFDLDTRAEIIPVEITETKMKVKCQSYYLDIIWLEDGEKFFMATKYPFTKEEELPRLSETEIAKILKNK